jgi:phosphatidate phosphatase APP1
MISRFTQLLVVLSVIFPIFVNAKTLVISDIDDTIKATHVLNTTDAVASQAPYLNEIEFGGMNAVYRLFQSQISKVKIYYVSNGLRFMGINSVPATFLAANNYPQAAHLSLRSSLDFYMNTKVDRIVEIIKKEKPSQLILIGSITASKTQRFMRQFAVYIHRFLR